jgi:hypothetical protein
VIGFWIMKSGEVSFYFVTFVQQTLTILSVSSIPACELYVISSSKFSIITTSSSFLQELT